MVVFWWDFTDEEFAQFNFRLYDREDQAAASPSSLMHVTPATSAMPQDLSAVWGQWRRWDSSPLHLEKWSIWYFDTKKQGPLIVNLVRHQVKLIFSGPQVTDRILCAHFHPTKVRVGASDGPAVAKDPDDGFLDVLQHVVLPADNQCFVVTPGIVTYGSSVKENTSFVQSVSNQGEWMLQGYFSYCRWGQWISCYYLLTWWSKTWDMGWYSPWNVMLWLRGGLVS